MRGVVVNYFQNLYLCDFQQPYSQADNGQNSCELLSKFVSLWFPTTPEMPFLRSSQLWITFKICIFVTSNNCAMHKAVIRWVVNYFQNLYLCDFKQHRVVSEHIRIRCELLSKFVSLWLQTTGRDIVANAGLLWITFKICIFVIFNNNSLGVRLFSIVVNYFQNLYLCDLKQHHLWKGSLWQRCELLSKFVSLWLPTTHFKGEFSNYELWITFKICIFVTPNNSTAGL